jgi:2-methylaconitate cis-trans-isomerase PrpF
MNEAVHEQVRVRIVMMRGGASKAIFLDANDVPRDARQRTQFLLALFGSPDRRQIDGLGGADLLTSKCAIMGRPSRPDADIDYTFVQVSVENPVVSYDIACGNITAAAAVYAIEEGYVQPIAPAATVRVHNTNTGKVMRITVPVSGGLCCVEGDFAIDGVPGTGAEVRLDFSQTVGAATGMMLPTRNVRDRIAVPRLGREIDVSIVDVANPCVFVAAEDVGLTGTEMPGDVPAGVLDTLEEIRVAACRISGIESYLLPFQAVVGRSRSYVSALTGATIAANECDLVARLFVERAMHKAYAGTGATCLAVAARLQGSVAHAHCASRVSSGPIRIGHPSGVLPIGSDVERTADGWRVNEVVFSRTARRLMEGWAYVRKQRLTAPMQAAPGRLESDPRLQDSDVAV